MREAWVSVGLVVLSVLLCVLAAPPFALWPAAITSWVPLIVALDGSRLRAAVGLGLLHGILLNGLGFYWMVPPLRDVAHMTLPGAVFAFFCLLVLQGARTGLIALLHLLARRRGLPRLFTFPIALVTGELVYPLIFPWYSALFAVHVTPWIQLAEFGGPLLISFWLATANAAISEIWFARMDGARRILVLAGIASAIVALPTAAGHQRVATVEKRIAVAPEARIGIAQGGISPARARGDSTAVYRHLTHELLRNETALDLIVWPESAVSYPVANAALAKFLRYMPVPERLGTGRPSPPVLLGMVVTDSEVAPQSNVDPTLKNAAVLVFPGGRVTGRYDKRRLVPLGEFAPGDSVPLFRSVLPVVNRFHSGHPRPAIEINGRRLGVSICYEAILHGEFLDAVRSTRPHLLVNLTSDSWFAGSTEPRLHLALASLRAVEHRRFLVRATTTGITALVDPVGRVVWTLPEGKPAAGIAGARWLEGSTVYGMLGDWPWFFLAGSVVAWVLAGGERVRRGLQRLRSSHRSHGKRKTYTA